MIVLYIILGILGFILLAFLVAYLFMPHFLIVPHSFMMKWIVKNPSFVDKEKYFPESKILEDNFAVIRNELLEVLRIEASIPQFHEVDKIQGIISANDQIPWRTFGILAFGTWLEGNASRAPKTSALIRQLPRVSLAMFSILDPGKRIPPHLGFNRMVYRYHLGLIIPTEGECWIRVGTEKYHWKEGEGVLFDDTYNHEVWNNSPQQRVVLFLDVNREHDYPKWLRPLNSWMFRLLCTSDKVKNGAKRAEIPMDIQPS